MKKYRMIHLDLKSAMPKMNYLHSMVKRLSNFGANCLLIEYEDKFPYKKHSKIVHPQAFSSGELKSFLQYAHSLGLETIPLIQSLSHVPYVLKHSSYKNLRENLVRVQPPLFPFKQFSLDMKNWQYCPLKKEVFDLLFDFYEEVFAFHPDSNYIHLGCDETWNLCRCSKCEKIDPAVSFSSWVNRLNREIKKRWGKNIMIWGDMMLPGFTSMFPTYPKIADLLDKDIVIAYWDYWNERNFPFLDFYKEKGFKVIASSATEGLLHPGSEKSISNIVGFIKESNRYDNVIGNLITCWGGAIYGETTFFHFGIGLTAMKTPKKDLMEIEKKVIEKLYATNNPKQLIDIYYLIGENKIDEYNAPWKLYAIKKAKKILREFNQENLGIKFLNLFSQITLFKCKRFITIYDIDHKRVEREKGSNLLHGLLKEKEILEKRTERLFQNILKKGGEQDAVKHYLKDDEKILREALK